MSEMKGKIIAIGELESYANSKGEGYSREVTIETDEQYAQHATFVLNNTLAQTFPKLMGDVVTVKFDFAGWQGRDGKWYNKLRVWRVE